MEKFITIALFPAGLIVYALDRAYEGIYRLTPEGKALTAKERLEQANDKAWYECRDAFVKAIYRRHRVDGQRTVYNVCPVGQSSPEDIQRRFDDDVHGEFARMWYGYDADVRVIVDNGNYNLCITAHR